MDNKVFTIDVDVNESIKDIKNKVSKNVQYPADQVTLIHFGT